MTNGTNPLKLRSIHHVELWVGNARQAAYFYRNAMGFRQIAYAGLETGSRDVTSYVLRQGKATIMLSTPVVTQGPMLDHLRRHGYAVRDIAFHVGDADVAYGESVQRVAVGLVEPHD